MACRKVLESFFRAMLVVAATSAIAGPSPSERPLRSVESAAFLKMDWPAQRLYVSGILDGITFVSYGRRLPDHDAIVQCAKQRSVDQVTRDVVAFVKSHPAFSESLGSAVAQSVSSACGVL